jgi:hypothetical protein
MFKMKWFNWKRGCILAVVLMVAAVSTGCGIDLTDEQNRVIAEYAADLLLKYDRAYQGRYEDTNTSTDDTDVEEVTETTTSEELTEETTTEEPTTEALTESTTEENTETEVDSTEDSDTEDDTIPPSVSDNVTDIAEIVGIQGMSIVYNKCMFLDRYPSLDQDGTFIYLDADPGYKLVVVKFDIINQSSQPIKVDLLNTDIAYRLVMNQTKAASPMLTILMDDLGTFNNTVPANSEQSAVLVFQMSDSCVEQIERLDIKVTYAQEEYVISVQ